MPPNHFDHPHENSLFAIPHSLSTSMKKNQFSFIVYYVDRLTKKRNSLSVVAVSALVAKSLATTTLKKLGIDSDIYGVAFSPP
jgi:hypothetical protein